jgi:hypothetical protein
MNSSNKINVNKGLSRVPNKASLISSLASNLRTTVALAALAASSLVSVKSATAENPYENTVACQTRQICDSVKGASDSLTVAVGHQSTKNPFDAQALSAAARLTIPTGTESDNLKFAPGLDFLFRAPFKGEHHSLELNAEYTLLNAEYGPNENVGRGHLAYRYQDGTWFLGAGGGYTEMVSPVDGRLFGHIQAGIKAQDLIVTLGADLMDVNGFNTAGYARLSFSLNDYINIYAQGSRGFVTNSEGNLDAQFSAMGGVQFTFDGGQVNAGIRGGHHVFSQNGFDTQLSYMHMPPKAPEQAPRTVGNSYIIESHTSEQEVTSYLDTQEHVQIITVSFSELDFLKNILFNDGAPTKYKDKVASLNVDFRNIDNLNSEDIAKALSALAFLTNQGRLQAAPSDTATIHPRIRAKIQRESRFRHLTKSFLRNTQLTGIHAHFSQIAHNNSYPRISTVNGHERIEYAEGTFVEANHAHFINGRLFQVIKVGNNHEVKFIKRFAQNINVQAPVLESHNGHSHEGTDTLITKLQNILEQYSSLTAILSHHCRRITFKGFRGQFDGQNLLNPGTQLSLQLVAHEKIKLISTESMGIGNDIVRSRTFRKR